MTQQKALNRIVLQGAALGPMDVLFLFRRNEVNAVAMLVAGETLREGGNKISTASFEEQAQTEKTDCRDWEDLILESLHIAFMQSEALRFEAKQAETDANMELGFREASGRRLFEEADPGSDGEDERQDFSEGSANDFADLSSSGELRMTGDQDSSESEDEDDSGDEKELR